MPITEQVLPFELWASRNVKRRNERETSRRARVKRQAPQHTNMYNPEKETIIDHAWFLLDVDAIKSKTRDMCENLVKELGIPGPRFKEFDNLVKELNELKDGPQLRSIIVSLNGQQGQGKSTSINALLHRVGLADMSYGSKACTQFATRFEYLPGAPDSTTRSNVSIRWLKDDPLRSFLEELIRRYYYFHFSVKKDMQDFVDEDNISASEEDQISFTEEDRRHASTAKEIFEIIFNTKNDLEADHELRGLLTASRITRGKLLRRCLVKAAGRIRGIGVEAENISHFFDVSDQDLEDVHDIASELWPLVEVVVIATGSTLLRSGIVLIDSPGFGDVNQSRAALANSARRAADYEMIVASPRRIETRADVDKHIKGSIKSHGVENTILIMNQIDREFEPTEKNINRNVNTLQEHPFPEIKKRQEDADEIDTSFGNVSEATLDKYLDYLDTFAGCATKRLEAEKVEISMRAIHGNNMSVFSVTALEYIKWMNPDRKADPAFTPIMSGIPELRRHLLSLPTESNYRNYYNHVFRTLPNITDKIGRILEKKADDEGFADLRQQLAHQIPLIEHGLRKQFTDTLTTFVPPMWIEGERLNLLRKIKFTISNWSSGVYWGTFNKVLRENGIPLGSKAAAYRDKDINWNRDLLETIDNPYEKRFVDEWYTKMLQSSPQVSNLVSDSISNFLRGIKNTINRSSGHPKLKKRAVGAWKKVENDIQQLSNGFQGRLDSAIISVYRLITTEEDINCMIARQNAGLYYQAYLEQGRGTNKRQQEALRSGLVGLDRNGKTFIDRYQDKAIQMMKENVESVFNDFLDGVMNPLQGLIDITEQFLITDGYQTTKHQALREILEDALPAFEKGVLEMQRMFPGCASQEDVEVRRTVKRIKVEEFDD